VRKKLKAQCEKKIFKGTAGAEKFGHSRVSGKRKAGLCHSRVRAKKKIRAQQSKCAEKFGHSRVSGKRKAGLSLPRAKPPRLISTSGINILSG